MLDVAQQLGKLAGHRVPQAEASRGVFAAFELDEPNESPGLAEPQTALSTADGWSIVERDLPLEITSEAAQEILTNLAAAASCVPGVEVTRVEGDEFDVTASIRFGPIRAQFTGSELDAVTIQGLRRTLKALQQAATDRPELTCDCSTPCAPLKSMLGLGHR